MPAIAINYNGASVTPMQTMVARRIGVTPPASNAQVTDYWRGIIAAELKSFEEDEARKLAEAGVGDPDIT